MMAETLSVGISDPTKEAQRALCSPPCEDTMRKWPTAYQEAGSYQTPHLPAPWPWTAQPPELWEIYVCYLSHPVYANLLQQLKLTKTFTDSVLVITYKVTEAESDHYFVQSHISSKRESQYFHLDLLDVRTYPWSVTVCLCKDFCVVESPLLDTCRLGFSNWSLDR